MKRMKLKTALKTRSQKALGDSLGLSQSYIHRLKNMPDCWLFVDDNNIPQYIEYTKKVTIQKKD